MKLRITPLILVSLVMTGVFLIMYWVLIMPEFRDLATQQQQQQELIGSSLKVVGGSAASKTARQQALADLKTQADLLLPSTDQQYDLTVQLEATAKNAGVAITSLTVNNPASGIPQTSAATQAASTSTVPRLTFTMGVTGSYASVQKWIAYLVSFDRFVQLDQVSINSSSTATSTDEVTSQVTGFAYYLP